MKNTAVINIFVDCHVFDKGFQGTRTYVDGLYKELVSDTNRHFFFAANHTASLRSVFGEASNISYLSYASKSAAFRLLVEIPYLIKKHKIHYAHFQYRVPPIKLCRYIVTTHDVLFEDFPAYFPKLNRIQSYFTYKFSANISDIVLTVSDYSKDRIEKHLGITNVIVTPNGIDSMFYETYDKDQVRQLAEKKYGVRNYIIFISRWEPRKQQDMLLKAFVDLELYRKHMLVFVGDHTFHNAAYDQIYDSLDNDIRIKILTLNRVPFDDMLLLLRGALASVYPSLAEGFGIPPLESLAAGVPTICSNATAMSDFDFLGEYLFDPYLQDEFNDKLVKVLQSDHIDLSHLISVIRQRYSWKHAADIYNLALHKNILTDSSP